MIEAGYREIEHTADWALEVWAPTLEALLRQAAEGMGALAGAHPQPGARLTRKVTLLAPDAESLLVDFLEELLYLMTEEGLVFDGFDLRVETLPEGFSLEAALTGAPLMALKKEIKAVTWHNLAVRRGKRGWETTVVFDV